MENDEITKKYNCFIIFLKKNNALKEFIRELRIDENASHYHKLGDLIFPLNSSRFIQRFKNQHSVISSSFIWTKTRKGQKYWSELDLEWIETMRKYNFK